MQNLSLVEHYLEIELLYFLLPSSCSHRKKLLQSNLSWVLCYCNLPVPGWSPKLCAELERTLSTEPKSEECVGSLDDGGLRLPKIVLKLAFHQAEKRQPQCALWTHRAATVPLGWLMRSGQQCTQILAGPLASTGCGKPSLWAGADCYNNPPPGKIEAPLSPLL